MGGTEFGVQRQAAARGLKDDRLAYLGQRGNLARFVSFGPGVNPELRHACLGATQATGLSVDEAVTLLLDRSAEKSVNVRSFAGTNSHGTPFRYGLKKAHDAAAAVRSNAFQGLYSIVNETIDVNDGGVSGVALGDLIEFAPDDTPRAVEKAGVAAAPRELARRMLAAVYGVPLKLPDTRQARIEFSMHPRRVGIRHEHVLLWEIETVSPPQRRYYISSWPHRFSRHLGDKAFGLLVANTIGLPVPRTDVIGRRVAPFSFGIRTNMGEKWLRTCPIEQEPGHFTTTPRWVDPFALLRKEDPDGTRIASVLSQDAVEPLYSGATGFDDRADDGLLVEGVAGTGPTFMLGTQEPEILPETVVSDVKGLVERASDRLGNARIEWVHDGRKAWILQLHVLDQNTTQISEGHASDWINFDPREGLERLREVVNVAASTGSGVALTRSVGITSHVGDILRRARVPARFAKR